MRSLQLGSLEVHSIMSNKMFMNGTKYKIIAGCKKIVEEHNSMVLKMLCMDFGSEYVWLVFFFPPF